MNLRLVRRNDAGADGVFSELSDLKGNFLFVTLEHSYNNKPKIPDGTYICKRGMHRLHSMTEDFETFEITGVEGHTNILFHVGNYNADSEGCVLLGKSIGHMLKGGRMICASKQAFEAFMKLQEGCDEFSLVVI